MIMEVHPHFWGGGVGLPPLGGWRFREAGRGFGTTMLAQATLSSLRSGMIKQSMRADTFRHACVSGQASGIIPPSTLP